MEMSSKQHILQQLQPRNLFLKDFLLKKLVGKLQVKIIYFPNGGFFQIRKVLSNVEKKKKKHSNRSVTTHPYTWVIYIEIDFLRIQFCFFFTTGGTFEVSPEKGNTLVSSENWISFLVFLAIYFLLSNLFFKLWRKINEKNI